MGMVVRTNMAGLNANNALNMASKTQQNAMQKLASGFRINKAADDASGLSISEKMKNQIKALDTAVDNSEDGANMIQTTEGYMAEAHDMINRMVELSEKAANGVLDQTDREALQDEMNELCAEIDRMATTANFNGKKLMDGSIGSNGIVKITSDATGNGYAISDKAPTIEDGTANAAVWTVPVDDITGDSLDELSGSKLADLKNKIAAAAEAEAAATATATDDAVDVTLAVNKNGDILTGDAATAALETDLYGAENTDGYSEITLTVEKAELDDAKSNPGIKLQIGESSTAADKLEVTVGSFHTNTLLGGINGFVNKSASATGETDANAVAVTKSNTEVSTFDNAITVDITSQDAASAAADALRQVSNYISDQRGQLGAQQNRLEHTVNNLTTASENITAANSRIRDTNMAEEMMNYTSKNVIAQAAQAMLAQANSQPQNVLSLLQ